MTCTSIPPKTIFTDSIAAHLGTDGQHRISVNGSVWFDAAPQDIKFETTGTSYTLQEAFDSKQDSLTAYTPASSTQLLIGTSLKALKAGTNITLANDPTSVTINGPVISDKQDTLTAATAAGTHPILSGTTFKCLKSAGNLSLTSDATSITLTGGSTIPILTTSKIIASSGALQSGSAWTGIIASNTAGQEIFYTNNDRNVNFKGNVVVDALCTTDSIQCTNNATVGGTLNVTGIASFAIDSST